MKALSDVIVHVVERGEDRRSSIPKDQPIIFAPDKHLGALRREADRPRRWSLWQGTCIVHETFSERKIIELLERHPGAELIAHPECEEPVLRHADFIGSTTGLLKYADDVAGARRSSSRPRRASCTR